MDVPFIRCLVITNFFLLSFPNVISRPSTVSHLNTTLDLVPVGTTLRPTRSSKESNITLSSLAVITNTTRYVNNNYNVTDYNVTDRQNVSRNSSTNDATDLTHGVSDIESNNTVVMEIYHLNTTNNYTLNNVTGEIQHSTDYVPLQHTNGVYTTTEPRNGSITNLYDDTLNSSVTTIEQTTTESPSTSHNPEDIGIATVDFSILSTNIEPKIDITIAFATTMKSTNYVNQYTTFTTKEHNVTTDDGLRFDDFYLPLAVSLVVIVIGMVLAYFIYIIMCNRVSSKRSAYRNTTKGAYTNKAFVTEVVAISEDEGIEILRTAL